MQLLYYSNIQLLFCDQDFDIAASQRVRHSNVEQGLVDSAAPHGKPFCSCFTGPMAILKACRHSQCGVRPSYGTKNKPSPGRLLETGFGFLDGWIAFQRGLKNTFQRDGAGSVHKTDQQENGQDESHPPTQCLPLEACALRKKETSFHRWPNLSGGLAMSA